MRAGNTRQIWQTALSNLVTDPAELFDMLNLDKGKLEAAHAACQLFPLKATRSYISRMKPGDLNDPLLLQVLPLGIEQADISGYVRDPLAEKNSNPIPGLLHKYHGRVLVTITNACAVHCRYCFRRHFPYAENNPGRQGWENIFSYIENNSTIKEVILSGGDPLSVSDKMLDLFTTQLASIEHVKTLRLHTRMPVVLPERICESLLSWIKKLRFSCVMVLHVNHAQEINQDVKYALKQLRNSGVTLLNQSVLLKNINDDANVLIKLSQTLHESGVLPYYLHTLDKVQGAHHFDLPLEQAKLIHTQLREKLPGYLVPRLATEEPGMPSKTLLL